MKSYNYDADTPFAFAWRMTGYKTDAGYIERMVEREYGQAPSRKRIQAMIDRRQRDKLHDCRAHLTAPDNDNGDHFQVKGLVPVKPQPKARPVLYIAPKPEAPKAASKPWPAWYSPPTNRVLVIERVAMATGLTVADIKGKSRKRQMVEARCIIAKILHDRKLSYPTIGRILGGRDHSTTINLVRRFDNYITRDEHLRAIYEQVKD